MKKLTILGSLVLLIALTATASANLVPVARDGGATQSQVVDKRVPGMIQVKYAVGSRPNIRMRADASGVVETGMPSVDAIHRDFRVSAVEGMAYQPQDMALASQLGMDRLFVLKVPVETDLDALKQRLLADPNIEAVIPVVEYTQHAVPTDPNHPQNWGHNNTAQMPAYDWGGTWSHTGPNVGVVGFDSNAHVGWDSPQGYGDPGVRIGIIDGGVDVNHPDLNYVGGWDFVDNDANPDEPASGGHGTACAGVAAAVVNNGIGPAGVAGNVGIVGLRANNNIQIASALTWAADNGVDVVSMSFSFPGFGPGTLPGVDAACAYAASKDVVLMSSAGNDNVNAVWTPSNHPDVMVIGAASPCGGRKRSSSNPAELNPGVSADPNGYTCDGERWWGSSWGQNVQDGAQSVDIIAPTILPTTDILGAGGYEPGDYNGFFNGTSCSCPYAAGVAALVRSLYPSWTAVQVRDHLRATAIDINDVDAGPGWDAKTGYGMVDIAAALALPDFTKFKPAGWSDAIVPSDVNTSTTTTAVFPAALPGDGTTYLNGMFTNAGTAPPVANMINEFFIDGVQTAIGTPGLLNPGWTTWWTNLARTISGGRHTLKTTSDLAGTELELDETNNIYARQFAWTPVDMAPNSLSARGAPPHGTIDQAALLASGNPASEFNNDSVGVPPAAGYWRVISNHSASNAADQDYDIALMNPTSDVFTGNDNASWTGEQSLNPAGLLDAVIINDNNAGFAPYEATLYNQTGTGTSTDYVEFRDSSAGPIHNADAGAYEVINFGPEQMVEIRELWTGGQTNLQFTLEVAGATQPVSLAVFADSTVIERISNADVVATTDASGKASFAHSVVPNTYFGVLIYRDPIDGAAPIQVTLKIRGPLTMTATNIAPAAVSAFTLPDGTGDPGFAAQLFGGANVDATVTAVITNSVTGTAQAGIPAGDMRWTAPGVTNCELLGQPADASTDAAGFTTFSKPWHAGGTGSINTLTVLDAYSVSLLGGGPAFSRNSADIDGNLSVDIADLGVFSLDFGGAYNYRSDYKWDGALNLGDLGLFSLAFGAFCTVPPLPATTVVAENSSIGIYFDPKGELDAATLPVGQQTTAYVIAKGPLAAEGISAWEARVEASDNVEIGEFFLGDAAINLGQDGDYAVGLGEVRRDPTGEGVILASFPVRVTDERPAQLNLVPSKKASTNEEYPVLVAGDAFTATAVVANNDGFATAILNDGSGRAVDTKFVFDGFRLNNHPNPFNPATEIRFALPHDGDVKIRIYNVAGRVVEEIDAGRLSTGPNSVSWNGTDRRGNPVVSGVYYYQLILDRERVGETKRMTLLK